MRYTDLKNNNRHKIISLKCWIYPKTFQVIASTVQQNGETSNHIHIVYLYDSFYSTLTNLALNAILQTLQDVQR